MGIYEIKSVDTHVLLRATEARKHVIKNSLSKSDLIKKQIVWVVLLAWFIQKERPTFIVIGVCICLIVGTTLISINLEEHVSANFLFLGFILLNFS